MIAEVNQLLAMNPTLSLEDINAVLQSRMEARNNAPLQDLCGLSPAQVNNWLYAPLSELNSVKISTPEDCSQCPTLRYLQLIIDAAIAQGGSFKATAKGNLPVSLVMQANAILPELPVHNIPSFILHSQFSGKNEDSFAALHYARILAEISGIIYRRAGRFHLKKESLKNYQSQGIRSFFLPMLDAAVSRYNWAYMDNWGESIDLRMFWLFMLWRISTHGSVQRLVADMELAFPALLDQLPTDNYFSPAKQLKGMIESRFTDGFLQFWGFMQLDPKRYTQEPKQDRKAVVQPLLKQAIQFCL